MTATVWAFCNGQWAGGDQAWLAVADDGEVLAQHISSSREWGQTDVGPNGHYRERYEKKFGEFVSAVRYVVLPLGELPPDAVRSRYEERYGGDES